MTQTNNSTSPPRHFSLGKRMLAGAGIGLLLISFFLLTVREANPAWGKLWMIRPLIIVPLAGATGAAFNYYIVFFRSLVGLSKPVAITISVIVFIVGLWVGTVLGLDGTLWN